MKKRLRKKLHKGEFQQVGISFFTPANTDNVNKVLDAITHIADKNDILFIGGGPGYIIMPAEKYGNMDVPANIEALITDISLSTGEQLDGIIGYFIKPFEKEICKDAAEKVKSELEIALGSEFKINLRIDLWN
ncbi:MAG: 50S ribosome-binding protein YggL [Candidatus Azobacteroides sp.]|nr:50S ribosome-binding protein YggL [Candidatus Azobacteroides sp.]